MDTGVTGDAMASREAATQRGVARLAGFIYLLVIAGGIFAEFVVRSRLVVEGDAAATASRIAASQPLFRAAFAIDLVVFSSDVFLAVAFYVLLKPVNRTLALLALFWRAGEAFVVGVNTLSHFVVLQLLSGADYLKAFAGDQLSALAMLALNAFAMGYDIGLVFFGFGLAVLGYLFLRSRYIPRVLAVLLSSASVAYLIGSFVRILAPAYAEAVSPIYLLPLVAELSLALWLAVRGVRIPAVE
jgi:hypothetical protein